MPTPFTTRHALENLQARFCSEWSEEECAELQRLVARGKHKRVGQKEGGRQLIKVKYRRQWVHIIYEFKSRVIVTIWNSEITNSYYKRARQQWRSKYPPKRGKRSRRWGAGSWDFFR